MLTTEKHYTLMQIAELWGSKRLYYSLRRWFEREPGVINAGSGKRNRHLLIPESVAARVYERRMSGGRKGR
jgi:hypothetical protein